MLATSLSRRQYLVRGKGLGFGALMVLSWTAMVGAEQFHVFAPDQKKWAGAAFVRGGEHRDGDDQNEGSVGSVVCTEW